MTAPTPTVFSTLVQRLLTVYGRPDWRPTGDPVGVLVQTILSQHTSDHNSARAYAALRTAYPTWEAVLAAPVDDLAAVIRCSGLGRVKARRIQAALAAIRARFDRLSLDQLADWPLAQARSALESLPGVGPKTAACVLLFALGRPAFPIDTHIHRVLQRLGIIGPGVPAEAAHRQVEPLVPPDLAYALHVLLIRHGRRICRAGRPRCHLCPLTDLCAAYQTGAVGAAPAQASPS